MHIVIITISYGPIMKENIFGLDMVLLSGVDLIEEFSKQDGKYPSLFKAVPWIEARNKHNRGAGLLTRWVLLFSCSHLANYII